MFHKTYLQIIATGVVTGAFLTVLAFSSNVIATANEISSDIGENTLYADASNGTIINDPLWEGGVSLSDPADHSSVSSESAAPVFAESSSTLLPNVLPSSALPSVLQRPAEAPSHTTELPKKPNPSGPMVSGDFSTAVSSKPSSQPSQPTNPSKPVESSKPSSAPSEKPSSSSTPSSSPKEEPSGETVKISIGGTVTEMDALTAVAQTVEGEMGYSFHAEALKAQAVATYSFIKYQNKSGNAPSLPMRTASQKVTDAVSAVLGQAIYCNGVIAYTPYHASSAGYTNSSAEVWGGNNSHLINVVSAYDPSTKYNGFQSIIPVSTVKSGLENFFNITLGENPSEWMSISATNQGGYVTKLTVTDENGNTHTTTGRKLRENILNYVLKSHAFTFTCDDSNFIFTTYGYGHGVGMSQTGANGYALQEGWNYKQILSHYYPGTTVK